MEIHAKKDHQAKEEVKNGLLKKWITKKMDY